MKKTLVALSIAACSTCALAFDMSEWTRNSSSTPTTTQSKPQIPQQAPNAVTRPNNITRPDASVHEDIERRVDDAVSSSVRAANSQSSNSASSSTAHQHFQQQIDSQNRNTAAQQNQNSGSSNNTQQNSYQYSNSPNTQYGGGSNVSNQSDPNQRPNDLTPQMEAQLNREATNINASINQIMRISTNGFNVNATQKAALESFNATLQMIASMWITGTSPAERQQISFEMYNYAVACATTKGVSNQARSLLGMYSQIGSMNGFNQFVMSRGKAIGTTGPTLGC